MVVTSRPCGRNNMVLAFTFCCTPQVWARVWLKPAGADGVDRVTLRALEYDAHHLDDDHGNNVLSNLKVLPLEEHRQLSGTLGGVAKRARNQ